MVVITHTPDALSSAALAVAGLGWVSIGAVPFVKYPANPPAVGNPETIDQRTWLWVATVVLGLVAVAVAVIVSRALAGKGFRTVRLAAPIVAFLIVVGLGYLVLPTIDEVSADFPATLLSEFRVSSLAVQITLWAALGWTVAFLTEHAPRCAVVKAT